jgi:WD40 repeat protein
VAVLRGHTRHVTAVAFSPDGKTLLSSSGDFIHQHGGETKLWDVATRRERRTFDHSSANCVAFSPDGREVASANFGYVSLWDVATGKGRSWSAHPGTWPGGGRIPRGWWIYAIAYSPDGRTLVTASDDQTARLWDTRTGKRIHEFAGPGEVYAVAFSSDGKRLAISSSDKFDEKLVGSNQKGTIRLFDPATGKLVREVATHTQTARCFAFLPGDRQLAVGSHDSGIEAWDVATGKKVRQLHPHPNFAACLAISPDCQRLAAAGWGSHAAVLCDVRTGRSLGPAGGAGASIYDMLVTPDGRLLTAGDPDAPIRVWDAASGKEGRPWKMKSPYVYSMALSPDGKIVATGMDGGTIQLRDAATGRELRQLKCPDRGYVWGIAFSPDSRALATGGNDGKVRLLDVASGKVMRELTADPRGVSAVAFSPDGTTLAASIGGKQGDVGLWDVATGKLRHRLVGQMETISALSFSPDGRLLATVTETHSQNLERALRLWDTRTGKELVHLTLGQADGIHSPGGRSVAFSPDGKTLATAGSDQTASLWETATGALRRRFRGHTGTIGKLAFSANGRTLASASSDTTVLLWDVAGLTPAEQRELPRAKAGPPLQRWEDLAVADAGRADRAIRLLAAAPAQTLPILREKLRPVAKPDAKRLERLVADLESDQFTVRDRATKELDQLGELAEPALLKRLESTPDLEARRRIDRLLARCAQTAVPAPERLRVLRAVEVLERIGSAEARRILESLAAGAEGARLTREAAASARRLARRGAMPTSKR